ncbi:hypothetical protein Dsin_021005 [Dipteronia sinensis]|uniref:Reverse transcriptase zinc-binding domain-containing protein n=1 Tax=Dipteronia sinensis TaxID=43782 RepID=A0AAE0AB27_9ROSI|nr:hypothetical protein Dsin_021005 [Dipteronia sinensis]
MEASKEFEMIWQGICPSKIEMFAWQLLRGRVLVSSVLQRFGLNPNFCVNCAMCKSEEETIDHLFLHCRWTQEVWGQCMEWWGVKWCRNETLKEWALGWSGLCPKAKHGRAWNSLFFYCDLDGVGGKESGGLS